MWLMIVRANNSHADNNADRNAPNVPQRSRARRKVAARNTAVVVMLTQVVAVPNRSRSAVIVKVATSIVRPPARKGTSGVSARGDVWPG